MVRPHWVRLFVALGVPVIFAVGVGAKDLNFNEFCSPTRNMYKHSLTVLGPIPSCHSPLNAALIPNTNAL